MSEAISSIEESVHVQLLSGEPAAHQATAERASRRHVSKRQPLSCLACRRYKLRCDRQVPCSTCVRYRRETQCRQNPAPPRKKHHGSASQRIRVSTDHGVVRQEDQFDDGTPPQTVDDSGQTNSHPQIAGYSANPALLAEPIAAAAANNIHLGRDEPRFQEFAERLTSLTSFVTGVIPTTTLPQLLAEISRRDSTTSLWRGLLDVPQQQQVWRKQLIAVLPSRAQCDLFVNYYFEHVNWIFQSVHEPSFRRDEAAFWNGGSENVDFIWLSLLFTTVSVSALYIPLQAPSLFGLPKESVRHLSHVWHQASQHALRAGDYEANPSLLQLQTFSVTQLYWYATDRIEALNS